MNKYQFFVVVLAGILGLSSCGKDSNFPSVPDLEYKNIYPKELSKSDSLAITCSFRDQEGDIDGPVSYRVYNITTKDTSVFSDYYVLPELPAQKNMEGDIIFILKPGVDFIIEEGHSDSIYFELFIRDRAGHTSDTVRTDAVLVHG